jgi:hypothetical protein
MIECEYASGGISFGLALLGLALHLEFVTHDFRLFLLLLLLLPLLGRRIFLLLQQLLNADDLAQTQSDLVAEPFSLFVAGLDGLLLGVDFLHRVKKYIKGKPFEALESEIRVFEEGVNEIPDGIGEEDLDGNFIGDGEG